MESYRSSHTVHLTDHGPRCGPDSEEILERMKSRLAEGGGDAALSAYIAHVSSPCSYWVPRGVHVGDLEHPIEISGNYRISKTCWSAPDAIHWEETLDSCGSFDMTFTVAYDTDGTTKSTTEFSATVTETLKGQNVNRVVGMAGNNVDYVYSDDVRDGQGRVRQPADMEVTDDTYVYENDPM